MFNQGAGMTNSRSQQSALAQNSASGSALMAASAKLKRKQTSPKTATSSGAVTMDPAAMKAQPGAPTGLKYAAQGGVLAQQQNFLDKYQTKTRNKLGQAVSAQQPGQAMANNDSVSSGNGGQPAMYPASVNSRKLHSGGQQIGGQYKAQGATSHSPKGTGSAHQTGKLLFAQQTQHQGSQAAIQSAGMHNFEEATKRQEFMTQSQQQLLAMRNPNYTMQRNPAPVKKELMRSEDYSRIKMAANVSGEAGSPVPQSMTGGAGMSPEYYSLNQRAKERKPNSPETGNGASAAQAIHAQHQAAAARAQAVQQQQHNQNSASHRSTSKQGTVGVTTNFMKRRVSEDKAGELASKVKPQLSGTRGNAIAYADYLDHSKARSPKIYPSKHLEQLKQVHTNAAVGQTAQTQMFNARAMATRPQVSSQTKQYQYLTSPANKTSEEGYHSNPATALAKSRNHQVTATTSQGSLGTKYKSTQKIGYAMSPKGVAVAQRTSKESKLKFGMKGSPKQYQASPTQARMTPALAPSGGVFGNEAGRNIQTSIRTKPSLGATSGGTSSGTMNYLRTSGSQNTGLSPTAQYKKVLMKGPTPLLGGKVLDDNDDDDDDYDDDDMDEQSPSGHARAQQMRRNSNDQATYVPQQTSPQHKRDKEQQLAERAARLQSQREQYQKQQRRLLRNIWIFTEKGDFQACYGLLVKQDPKLAQALLNECNSDGWTPLHVASNEGHVEMIEIFAQFGAHLDCKAKNLRTPLHVACIRGNAPVLQALLNQGADFDAKDCDGNTPCHMISQYGHTQCLQVLLEKHPKLVTRNKDGVSPMDVAYNKEILAIFQEYINRVQNIFASQQSSSKYSTSSRESGNGSGSATVGNNAKDGASSKVPNSLSKPDRQTSANATRPPGRASPEEIKQRISAKHQLQQQQQREALTAAATSGARPQQQQTQQTQEVPRSGHQAASRTAQKPTQVGQTAGKAQNKNVPIHDSLNKHNDAAKHKKTRSYGQEAVEPAAVQSSNNSQADEETLRVGPEDFMPLKMLGSGSFGEVYLVREIRSGDLFAMKVLTKAKIFGNNLVRYAKTERDVLSYTKHPFIVGLNYAFQTETKLFLILDFCPGGDLGRVLQREGRLTEERARKYLCEVLLAIEALHKRDIIFRDLKPDNVVIDTDGHACLTDFGLSKEGVFDPSRGAKSFCGSVAYLAPEMIRKAGHGKSVDWYLLGVILYEMIVGQPPYFSESKETLFNNIQRGVLKLPVSMSQEAKNLIVHLLNRNPSKRLGAGAGGAVEIKRHPFFGDIDWEEVGARRLDMPAPRHTIAQFKKQYESFNCTEEQKRQIFEDITTQDTGKAERVEGWSFVNRDDGLQDVGLNEQIGIQQEPRVTPEIQRRGSGGAQASAQHQEQRQERAAMQQQAEEQK